jgi:hypothetical protein
MNMLGTWLVETSKGKKHTYSDAFPAKDADGGLTIKHTRYTTDYTVAFYAPGTWRYVRYLGAN